ncbi:DNA dependent ATPase [Suhomyces tanzawaensis NRRL Y-17324]|uniref:DNA dependent ATPase n=1 Tax=Suhomyces tanzawaensis NRRL Y-17324 TaxID=984487 RepID=A0A1E4SM33_9ASCO|nr:DNA dependent ATPase [Suhomyces tanzawaensis NRRL Y-17324]ODV80573.1 DNA dependent ATPase [Suhomyces tanzawaensis NRRL Y-17324]
MSELESLGVQLVDQTDLESTITAQANQALLAKDSELDQKRLEKATKDLNSTLKRIRILSDRLNSPRTKLSQRKQIRDEIKWFEENELAQRQADVNDITARLSENKKQLEDAKSNGGIKAPTNERLAGESEKDFLIRTGKITAFGNENTFKQDYGDGHEAEEVKNHQELRAPGFEPPSHAKRRKLDSAPVEPSVKDEPHDVPSDADSAKTDTRNIDDGDELVYLTRLKSWTSKRSGLRAQDQQDDRPEWQKPHPAIPDAVLNDKFKLPGDIYPSLFDYQKTCVQWLWELYSQKTGGIIGDEMGLGKTIQIISFIAGLHYSGLLDKPVLVVVPATVLNQWVNEFHRWWPPLRCVILHSIGSGMGNKASEEKLEEYLETHDPKSSKSSLAGVQSQINAKEIVDRVIQKGHVLITTYVGLRIYSKYILPNEWGYVVLDEGHKIRNPDLDISLTCKQIKSYNRVILSGTPIQNNLIELWSLFDFIFPGRLGTLPVFQQQFSIPINMGGYSNASNIQIQTGYKCAVVLRDLISPYLLRRLKSDVAKDLPKKNEMVLFVKLTKIQQDLYEKFLSSEDLDSILRGKRNVLMGVDILRKICNHPDLVHREALLHKANYNYGDPVKSGKMQVLKDLLQLWQSQKHKTLLFCQTRQMLDILEKFVANLKVINLDGEEKPNELDDKEYFSYLRMDGSTPISRRQTLVDSFNETPSIDVFLLTTKVGGLGVNLTGADRVIIFDPDWNPSTDIQARERAWRLGQKKDITIYRLMTTGSIEEKIYHRQIFKTFLTNKILKDPKQRRFFKVNDLHDLFTLGDQNEEGTETGDMFNGTEKTIGGGSTARRSTKLIKPAHKNDDDFYQVANIMGVSKLDKFEGDREDEGSESKDDNRLMEGIFAKGGVHSTLKHDDIIDSGNQELSLVEKEANKVANEAAKALRESRKLTRKNQIGTPTWTGKFGFAGKFGAKNGAKKGRSSSPGTLASSSILDSLKQKKGVKESIFTKEKPKAGEGPDKKELMDKLIKFLHLQPNHFSTSNDILRNVGVKMTKESDTVLMRSMLRETCDWRAEKKGWELKQEFRE